MDVPTSEVGYTSAVPRREDHEVHKDMWGALGEKIYISLYFIAFPFLLYSLRHRCRIVGYHILGWALEIPVYNSRTPVLLTTLSQGLQVATIAGNRR